MTRPRGDDVLVLSAGDWFAVLALAGAGLLLGGVTGLLVALLGVAATAREGGYQAARAAFLLLVLAAVATVVEVVPTHSAIGLDFSARRPVAARAAEAAGVLALVALVGFAYTERPRFSAVALPAPERGALPTRLRSLSATLPYAVVALVAVAVRTQALPTALPPGYGPEVTALQAGGGFTTALRPPLATVIAAFAPGTARAALLVVSALTVVAVMRLAGRLAGGRAALLAGLVAAVLPSLWGQQLPEAVGALAVTTALVVLWPPALDVRRAALSGLALAAAALARPEALLVVPVALAWILVSRGRRALPQLAVAGAVGALAFAPWQLWVQRSFDSWLPATSLGPTLAGSTVEEVLSGRAMGSFRPTSFSRPGGEEGARDRKARAEGVRRSLQPRLPLVITARVLRGWDLWPGQGGERARRSLPFPGGRPGVVVEVAVAALAGWGGSRVRHAWRPLLPLFALPALFTLVSAGTFGDRGLKYLAAPSLALLSGLALALLGEERLRRPGRARRAEGRRRWERFGLLGSRRPGGARLPVR